MHIENISYVSRAHNLSRAYHGATDKAAHFQPLMTALFELFGVTLLSVARFDSAVRDSRYGYTLYTGFIDLLCPGVLLVHAGDAGTDLDALLATAHRQVDALPKYDCPTHLLVTDLQRFLLYTGTAWRWSGRGWHLSCAFDLAELAEHVDAFAFISATPGRGSRTLPEAATDAARLLARLRADLLATNYPEADVDLYMIRLLLIFGMDGSGTFYRLILNDTRKDGSGVDVWIQSVVEALATPLADRSASLGAEMRAFPYIGGALFKRRLKRVRFSADLRLQLLELIAYNWNNVALALIGARYLEAVASHRDQRRRGWHQVSAAFSVPVLQPLFLSELQQAFELIRYRRTSEQPAQLNALWDRLVSIRVLDPACGPGYFLTACYLALRALETDIVTALQHLEVEPAVANRSRLTVEQMVGIESDPTAAQLAWTSLLLAEHRANTDLARRAGGEGIHDVPLPVVHPLVHCRDALAIDWATRLPPERCSYIVGNPPYGGATPVRQGAADTAAGLQRKRLRKVEQQFDIDLAQLDFAAAWLVKAADMARRSEGRTRVGFVVTGSLTQGEQVSELWPILFDRYQLAILFAQRPVSWSLGYVKGSVAAIGLAARDGPGVTDTPRLLFERVTSTDACDSTELLETQVPGISAYLRAATTPERTRLVIPSRSRPICDVLLPRSGSRPGEGQRIVKGIARRDALLAKDPGAVALLRPYVGTEQMLHDTVPRRWILVIADDVSRARLDQAFIGIPEVIDQRQTYLPIGWLAPPAVPSNLLKILPADPWLFGVLSSRAHMAWLQAIGGVLDGKPGYSIRVVYNNFPWPEADPSQRALVGEFAEAVLAVRAAELAKEMARVAAVAAADPEAYAEPYCPLSKLYEPNQMSKPLLQAHRALDVAVEKLYLASGFSSTADIVEHLFDRYVTLTAELTP